MRINFLLTSINEELRGSRVPAGLGEGKAVQFVLLSKVTNFGISLRLVEFSAIG